MYVVYYYDVAMSMYAMSMYGVNPERQPSLSRWEISAVSLASPAYMDIATS